MDDSFEKLVHDIVQAIYPEEFTLQKQFYLTQSLLTLVRTAHKTGYKQGCIDTTSEMNRLFKLATTDALEPEALADLAKKSSNKSH